MSSEDQVIRTAMNAPMGLPADIRAEPTTEGTELDRQDMLAAIARERGPQKAALQFDYDHKFAGGPASAPASSFKNGFPELSGGGPAPSTPAPAALARPAMSDSDVLKAAFGGPAPATSAAPPLSGGSDSDLLARAFGPPKEGTLARAARIASDPEGGILPAAGSLLNHVLGGDSAPTTNGGVAATAGDMGRKVAAGVIGLGESVVGVANLASGGTLGSLLTRAGYDPKQATEMLGGFNSEAQQQSDANVGQAQGFVDKLQALAVNPRAVFGQVAEMAPSLLGLGGVGGAFTRAAMPRALAGAEAAGLTGEAAEKFVSEYIVKAAQAGTAAALAGQTGGSVAEAGRQSGQDFSQYAPAAVAAALATAGLAYGSKVAFKALGVGDVATDIATGGASRTTGGFAGAAVKEAGKGAVENAAFSGVQGAGTNVATGQPWDANDLGGQVAQGAAVGGLVSGLHGALAHGNAPALPIDAAAADAVANSPHDPVGAMRAAVDGYLGTSQAHEVTADIAQAPTVEAAIAAADTHSQSASAMLAAAAGEAGHAAGEQRRVDGMRQAIDDLATTPGEAPKVPTGDPLVPDYPASAVDSSQYADLTPMDQRTAQGRLTAMRGMQDSGDQGLNVVPHPDGTGRFAIGKVGTTPDATRAGEPVTINPKELPGPANAAPPAAAPRVADTLAAMRTLPSQRSAEQMVTLAGAKRAYTPELMDVLDKAANRPFAMTSEERLRYSGVKDSESRSQATTGEQHASLDEAAAAASTPEAQRLRELSAARYEVGGSASAAAAGPAEKSVRTDPSTLPLQRDAKPGQLSQEHFQLIKQVGRMLGKKVVLQDLGKNDGQVDLTNPNTIHLNPNSSVPHLAVFGHEVYHLMKAEHPEAAKVLADAMGLKADANLDVAGIRGDHEEVQSDLLGNRFKDPKFWTDTFRKVLEADGRPAVNTLGATIARVVRSITRAMGGMKGFDTDSMTSDLGKVKDAASSALAEYITSRKGAAIEMDRDVSKNGENLYTSGERVQSAKFSETRGKLDPEDLVTKATGKDGQPVNVTLHKEMLGDNLHSVLVKAEDGKGLAGWVEFNRNADGTLSAGMVKSERPGNGVAEMLYRAARNAGYDLTASKVQTEAGKGFTQRLAEKGVIRASEKRNDDAIDVDGVHYSKEPRTSLSSAHAGMGLKGAEKERPLEGAISHRVNFYVDKGQGIQPEAGVGAYAHKARLTNLYDAGNDPKYLKEDSKDSSDFERQVVAKGYDGYYNPDHTNRTGAAVLLGDRNVPVEQIGQGARPPSGTAPDRSARADEGYRATVAQLRAADLPAGEMLPAKWEAAIRRADPALAEQMSGTFERLQAEDRDLPLYKNDLIKRFKEDAKNEEPKGSALLNVGLDVSDENGGGRLSPEEVRAAVAERGHEVTDHEIHQSDTEPTMVARLDRPMSDEDLHGLSKRLRQDAIAQRAADGTGSLEGPKAEDWGGKYNPDFFRRMDGRTDTEHGATEVRASAKREELNPDVVQTLGKHIRDLLPDERARLRRDTAQKLVDTIKQLPSANEMAAVAYAGRAKRGWYEHSARAMEHVFGGDAPRFAALLAALSPQTGVEDNLKNALNVWKAWVQGGRPSTREEIIDIMGKNVQGDKGDQSVLDAWRNNTVRALTRADGEPMKLSGPKVNSFFRNLIGHTEEVTNDTWMANYALVSQKIFAGTAALDKVTGEKLGQKSPGYLAMSAQVRAAAKALTKYTGEEWTPAEVQETIWSWAKTLYERANVNESAVDLVKNKALTDELINSTPDFRTLFHDDTNERILRDAGYGDQLDSLRSRGDLGRAGAEEPGAESKTAPFADDAQQRYELAAARRLDTLRARGREPVEDDVKASEQRITDDNTDREYTPEQKAAFTKIGRTVEVLSTGEKLAALRTDIGRKLQQGLVDQFAPIKDLGGAGYLLARLSKGAAGAFDAFLNHGKLSLKDGVYDADMTGGAIDTVFKPLGHESGDFLSWIAGNRAERLTGEGRERLFSPDDIAAYKSLDKGLTKNPYTLTNGEVTRDRSKIYPDALRKYDEFNRNALDMAEQSGLIDKDSRKVWENEMYVPFYRVAEQEGGFLGNNIKKGLVRQQAFQKLKGGTDKLNSDLLANTLQNWSHLIDAGAKNRAAKATLEAAVAQNVATEGEGKKSVWFLDNGNKRSFLVDEAHAPILAAIQSLEGVSSGPVMKAMSTFKKWMTIGATASPAFKIRHLIRGSMVAMAVSDTKLNPIANAIQGFSTSSKKSQTYVSTLAGGGIFHFGTMVDGDTAANVRKLVNNGVDHATILDSDDKLASMLVHAKQAFDTYNEFSNRGEEMPRTALYAQNIAKGMSHAEATLKSRDLLDYSLTGAWPAIRMIAQTVPFMNARAQGLYKLGRAAMDNPARMATVLGAMSLASVSLMAANADDEDMKKRDDSDVDGFWAFKVGGTMYRIPKPFELGAVATLAERTVQRFTDPEMTNGRFLNIVASTIGNQLNMNPIPQAVKPILDIYANKDAFTGKPIESAGMEKMQSSDRYGPATSDVARGAGSVLQSVFDATGLTAAGHSALSPVQIDHLVGGYFGWLGGSAMIAADMLTRPMTSLPSQAAPDYLKMATGGLAAQAQTGSSRYITEFYEQSRVLQQTLGSFQALVKQGKGDEARAFLEDNRAEIAAARSETGATQAESRIVSQIRIIQNSTGLDPQEKRERIIELRAQQSTIAERVTAAARGG